MNRQREREQQCGRTKVNVRDEADSSRVSLRGFCSFMSAGLIPYSRPWRRIQKSQKARQNPEIQGPILSVGPDVQPIGPALAELLNPAINRGDAGMGSGTGLQPPPDNSKDRRSGGEAAIHRARKSTPKNFPEGSTADPYPMPLRQNPQPPGARQGLEEAPQSECGRRPITAPPRRSPRSIRNWQSNSASPPRRKTPPRWRGRRATRWRRSASQATADALET